MLLSRFTPPRPLNPTVPGTNIAVPSREVLRPLLAAFTALASKHFCGDGQALITYLDVWWRGGGYVPPRLVADAEVQCDGDDNDERSRSAAPSGASTAALHVEGGGVVVTPAGTGRSAAPSPGSHHRRSGFQDKAGARSPPPPSPAVQSDATAPSSQRGGSPHVGGEGGHPLAQQQSGSRSPRSETPLPVPSALRPAVGPSSLQSRLAAVGFQESSISMTTTTPAVRSGSAADTTGDEGRLTAPPAPSSFFRVPPPPGSLSSAVDRPPPTVHQQPPSAATSLRCADADASSRRLLPPSATRGEAGALLLGDGDDALLQHQHRTLLGKFFGAHFWDANVVASAMGHPQPQPQGIPPVSGGTAAVVLRHPGIDQYLQYAQSGGGPVTDRCAAPKDTSTGGKPLLLSSRGKPTSSARPPSSASTTFGKCVGGGTIPPPHPASRTIPTTGVAHRSSVVCIPAALPSGNHNGTAASVAPPPVMTPAALSRLWAATVTGAMRTLGSLTTHVRMRLESLSALLKVLDSGAQVQLQRTAMLDTDPFVTSSMTLMPVLCFQLLGKEPQAVRPVCAILDALMNTLGTLLADTLYTSTLPTLLSVWNAPQLWTVASVVAESVCLACKVVRDPRRVLPLLYRHFSIGTTLTSGGLVGSSVAAAYPSGPGIKNAVAQIIFALLDDLVERHVQRVKYALDINGAEFAPEDGAAYYVPWGLPTRWMQMAMALKHKLHLLMHLSGGGGVVAGKGGGLAGDPGLNGARGQESTTAAPDESSTDLSAGFELRNRRNEDSVVAAELWASAVKAAASVVLLLWSPGGGPGDGSGDGGNDGGTEAASGAGVSSSFSLAQQSGAGGGAFGGVTFSEGLDTSTSAAAKRLSSSGRRSAGGSAGDVNTYEAVVVVPSGIGSRGGQVLSHRRHSASHESSATTSRRHSRTSSFDGVVPVDTSADASPPPPGQGDRDRLRQQSLRLLFPNPSLAESIAANHGHPLFTALGATAASQRGGHDDGFEGEGWSSAPNALLAASIHPRDDSDGRLVSPAHSQRRSASAGGAARRGAAPPGMPPSEPASPLHLSSTARPADAKEVPSATHRTSGEEGMVHPPRASDSPEGRLSALPSPRARSLSQPPPFTPANPPSDIRRAGVTADVVAKPTMSWDYRTADDPLQRAFEQLWEVLPWLDLGSALHHHHHHHSALPANAGTAVPPPASPPIVPVCPTLVAQGFVALYLLFPERTTAAWNAEFSSESSLEWTPSAVLSATTPSASAPTAARSEGVGRAASVRPPLASASRGSSPPASSRRTLLGASPNANASGCVRCFTLTTDHRRAIVEALGYKGSRWFILLPEFKLPEHVALTLTNASIGPLLAGGRSVGIPSTASGSRRVHSRQETPLVLLAEPAASTGSSQVAAKSGGGGGALLRIQSSRTVRYIRRVRQQQQFSVAAVAAEVALCGPDLWSPKDNDDRRHDDDDRGEIVAPPLESVDKTRHRVDARDLLGGRACMTVAQAMGSMIV